MGRQGQSCLRKTNRLIRRKMNYNYVLHSGIDRRHGSYTGPARPQCGNMRVVDARALHHPVAVQRSHKAEKVQPGKDNA